jgi:hypothetical protein
MSEETTSALALRVACIPDLPMDQVLDVMNAVEVFQHQAREIKQQLEQRLKDWILEHGEIEIGDKRYYVGVHRKSKPAIPLPELVAVLMDVTGGDFDRFCQLLAANAFKPGECKKALGERFDEVFETTTETDVETGKPKQSVKMFDKKFGNRG